MGAAEGVPAVLDGVKDLLALRAPSSNRVYADASGPLAVREAQRVLSAHLDASHLAVREERVAGIDCLRISSDAPRDQLVRLVGTLSGILGVFADADGLLAPLEPRDSARHPSDLETTLRYPGKTNEQFTALLLNLAAACSERRAGLLDGTLSVLDPMCGRGTTLSRALRLGLSPVGADIDKADIEAYRAFLLTWLRTHRLRHTSQTTRLSDHGQVLGSRFVAELAATKEGLRAGRAQTLTLLRCDTAELGRAVGRSSVDALVTDLPYGIQHGGHGASGLRRSPLEILTQAAPVWRGLLRADGGAAIALNRRTAPYPEAQQVLERAGWRVISADGEFRHRVDQSIERDVLLAVRTDHPRAEQLAAGTAC